MKETTDIPDDFLAYAGTPPADWPEELHTALASDPDLEQRFHEQARVAGLVRLKTYEHPDPARVDAQCDAILSTLQSEQGQGGAEWTVLQGGGQWLRVAALIVIMLGMSVWTHREMLHEDQAPPVATAIETGPSLDPVTPPSYLFRDSFVETDSPFFTPIAPDMEAVDFSPELMRQIEESFAERQLLDTNHLNVTRPLIPVRQTWP